MSLRFGDKTRAGEAVTTFGQRPTGGTTTNFTMTEQVFTSPGTWTKPATVTWVEILVVGGGGGGGSSTRSVGATDNGGGGGGGGVWSWVVPVSGPVPVIVGAGGTGGFNPSTPTPNQAATAGGTSIFGPPTPGPTSYQVGGGGYGMNAGGSSPLVRNAPPNGGGCGGYASNGTGYLNMATGGRYGYGDTLIYQPTGGYSFPYAGSGAGGTADRWNGGAGRDGNYGWGAPGYYWYQGSGGAGSPGYQQSPTVFRATTSGTANTGGGGGGGGGFSPSPTVGSPTAQLDSIANGGNGGSGVVIVRHWS